MGDVEQLEREMKKLGEKVVKEMKSAIDELEFVSLQHSIQ